MPRNKSAAQLDREIAGALARKPSSRHHARLKVSGDAWDVVMDALLEHDPEKAAQIWRDLQKEHGYVKASTPFLKALHGVPDDVRAKFQDYVSGLAPKTNAYALPAYYEMKQLASNFRLWFKALEETKKPGYKGLKVEWDLGARKPTKAKQSSILSIDIRDGYYKRIDPSELPPEVFVRFEEV
jgi:hypothetical protein